MKHLPTLDTHAGQNSYRRATVKKKHFLQSLKIKGWCSCRTPQATIIPSLPIRLEAQDIWPDTFKSQAVRMIREFGPLHSSLGTLLVVLYHQLENTFKYYFQWICCVKLVGQDNYMARCCKNIKQQNKEMLQFNFTALTTMISVMTKNSSNLPDCLV